MEDKTPDILERPDREQEEAAVAELSPEAQKLVDKSAEQVVKRYAQALRAKRRFYRKDRRAWDRMNRPEKRASIERGADKIHDLHARLEAL